MNLAGVKKGDVVTLVWIVLSASCVFHRPPEPPTLPSPIPPVAEASIVQIGVSADLEPVRAAIQAAIPRVISEDPPEEGCNEWGIYREENVRLTAIGNTLTVEVPLVYKIKLALDPLCFPSVSCGYGEPPRRATVIVPTALTWNQQWHLNADANTRIDLIDACELSALHYDAREEIRKRIQPHLSRIDQLIESQVPDKTNVKPQAAAAWSQLQEALRLSESVWLLVDPHATQVGPLVGSGRTMNLSAGLISRPTVILSENKPPATSNPFPNLDLITGGDRFHIVLDGRVTYDEATKVLKEKLVGRRYPIGSRQVTIRDVRVYSSGATVILQVTFDGHYKGIVYFQGTPTYTSVTPEGELDVISVPNLDFDVDTKQYLIRVASWLLHQPLVDSLKAAARVPLHNRITDLQKALNAGLNQDLSPTVRISGTVDALAIRGFYYENEAIYVRAVADGTARVSVR